MAQAANVGVAGATANAGQNASQPAAAPGGFWNSVKEQAPGALLNTGLMMALPMAMNAFSGSGDKQQQG
jgi:hypothetical protein